MGGTKARATRLKSYITLNQKNREITLTAAEPVELELCQQLDILISFLKIRAYIPIEWQGNSG